MAKEKAPAFQFYANDFISGTAEMSNAEVGAYIRLLCHQWDKEELPNEVKILVRLCNGDDDGVVKVMEKFCENKNGKLSNKKLEKVRENQKNYSKKQSENGKKSAQKRWGKGLEGGNGGYILVTDSLQPKSNSSSSTSSSTSIKESTTKSEESAPAVLPDLSKSNLFRQPEIPNKNQVWEYFSQQYATKEMAKSFYEKYEGVGWFLQGSAIANWKILAQRFIGNWLKNEEQKSTKEKTISSAPPLKRVS